MPFITEEIYQLLKIGESEACVISEYPKKQTVQLFVDEALEIVVEVRAIRSAQGLSPKEKLQVIVDTNQREMWSLLEAMICKLANIDLTYAKKARRSA